MNQYLGIKIVSAERGHWKLTWAASGNSEIHFVDPKSEEESLELFSATTKEEGYKVVYENGYESWCPVGAFEADNVCLEDEMDFGRAMVLMMDGFRAGPILVTGEEMVYWKAGSKLMKASKYGMKHVSNIPTVHIMLKWKVYAV